MPQTSVIVARMYLVVNTRQTPNPVNLLNTPTGILVWFPKVSLYSDSYKHTVRLCRMSDSLGILPEQQNKTYSLWLILIVITGWPMSRFRMQWLVFLNIMQYVKGRQSVLITIWCACVCGKLAMTYNWPGESESVVKNTKQSTIKRKTH